MPDIALYQPDIPQNTGTILRLAACLGSMVHIIEPCGFVFTSKALRRAGMDYIEESSFKKHTSWHSFDSWRTNDNRRLILLTTKATCNYTSFEFKKEDILLLGRESAGVPEEVHQIVNARLRIPLVSGKRSLNVAVSAGIVLGEAYRQTNSFAIQNWDSIDSG